MMQISLCMQPELASPSHGPASLPPMALRTVWNHSEVYLEVCIVHSVTSTRGNLYRNQPDPDIRRPARVSGSGHSTFAARLVCPDPDTFCPSAFVRIRTLRMARVWDLSGSGLHLCPDPDMTCVRIRKIRVRVRTCAGSVRIRTRKVRCTNCSVWLPLT